MSVLTVGGKVRQVDFYKILIIDLLFSTVEKREVLTKNKNNNQALCGKFNGRSQGFPVLSGRIIVCEL
jgi:hypothetical protein